MNIEREAHPLLVTIGTTVGASSEIDTARCGGGSFQLPAGSGTTAITVYAQVGTVDYAVATDEDWQPIAAKTVAAGTPYPLPSIAYNYPRIKLVASSGTATSDVPVFLKG